MLVNPFFTKFKLTDTNYEEVDDIYMKDIATIQQYHIRNIMLAFSLLYSKIS